MRYFFFFLVYFVVFDSKAQRDEKYHSIIALVYEKLDDNYDTTIFLENQYKELVFDNKQIFNYVNIKAYSEELGRLHFPRDAGKEDIKNYIIKAVFFEENAKDIYYTSRSQYMFYNNPRLKIGNNYKQLRYPFWSKPDLEFSPVEKKDYKLEILTDREIVTDTVVNEVNCYNLQRALLYNYVKKKTNTTWSNYQIKIDSKLIINKNDCAVIIKEENKILSNKTNEQIYKSKFVTEFAKYNDYYYRKSNYYLYPRFDPKHPVEYNDEGLYTLIFKESTPSEVPLNIENIPELPFAPYKEFCGKLNTIPELGNKLFKETLQFLIK